MVPRDGWQRKTSDSGDKKTEGEPNEKSKIDRKRRGKRGPGRARAFNLYLKGV